jgi:hypothetical protein
VDSHGDDSPWKAVSRVAMGSVWAYCDMNDFPFVAVQAGLFNTGLVMSVLQFHNSTHPPGPILGTNPSRGHRTTHPNLHEDGHRELDAQESELWCALFP